MTRGTCPLSRAVAPLLLHLHTCSVLHLHTCSVTGLAGLVMCLPCYVHTRPNTVHVTLLTRVHHIIIKSTRLALIAF